MKKNVLLALLIAGVVGLVVVVVRQRVALSETKEAAQIKPQRSVERIEQRGGRPVLRATGAEKVPPPRLAIASTATQEAPPSQRPAPVKPPTSAPPGNMFTGLADMMKNPEMKDVMRGQQKMALRQMYGALSSYIEFSPEKQAALENLLFERQMAAMEVGLGAMTMTGSEEDRKKAMADVQNSRKQYDQAIADLLGEEDDQTFQDYEKTVGDRVMLQMFKSTLPADAALTEKQEYDLLTAMYEERTAMPSLPGMDGGTPDPSQMTEEFISLAIKQQDILRQKYSERAKTILSPEQCDEFDAWQQQMGAMQAAGMKMGLQMMSNTRATASGTEPGSPVAP